MQEEKAVTAVENVRMSQEDLRGHKELVAFIQQHHIHPLASKHFFLICA